ncbi:MAG: hypothetical protein IIA58_02670 [Candidatus Marinimicrobia bacterium]|nr:hypothetical protein [Candidatus Neomarinimicrobiota bacterium]
MTKIIKQLPPMAGLIPLKAGHTLNPLIKKEGKINSPLLRRVDTSHVVPRRRGVSGLLSLRILIYQDEAISDLIHEQVRDCHVVTKSLLAMTLFKSYVRVRIQTDRNKNKHYVRVRACPDRKNGMNN